MAYAWLSPGQVMAAGAIFAVLAILLSGSRLVTQYVIHSKWRIDDWLILPAAIVVLGMGITVCIGVGVEAVAYGTPRTLPTEDFSFQQSTVIKIIYAINMMSVASVGLIKLSLLFYYRSIFNVEKRTLFNFASISTILLVTTWLLVFLFSLMFMCGANFSANWTSLESNITYCWTPGGPEFVGFLLAWSWTDFITDVMVFVFPIPNVLKLHMSIQKKLLVIGIFAIGAMSIVASLVRAVLFTQFMQAFNQPYDFDMIYSNGIYWMVIESGFALCVVNLPAFYTSMRHQRSQQILSRLRYLSRTLLGSSSGSGREGNGAADGSVPLSWRQPHIGRHNATADAIGKSNDECDTIDTRESRSWLAEPQSDEERGGIVVQRTTEVESSQLPRQEGWGRDRVRRF